LRGSSKKKEIREGQSSRGKVSWGGEENAKSRRRRNLKERLRSALLGRKPLEGKFLMRGSELWRKWGGKSEPSPLIKKLSLTLKRQV